MSALPVSTFLAREAILREKHLCEEQQFLLQQHGSVRHFLQLTEQDLAHLLNKVTKLYRRGYLSPFLFDYMAREIRQKLELLQRKNQDRW